MQEMEHKSLSISAFPGTAARQGQRDTEGSDIAWHTVAGYVRWLVQDALLVLVSSKPDKILNVGHTGKVSHELLANLVHHQPPR